MLTTKACLGYTNQESYYQYLADNGTPLEEGGPYYENIIYSMTLKPKYFITNNKPNENFFTRIQSYLNELQYESSQSIDLNSNTIDSFDYKFKYEFLKNGDFTLSTNKYIFIIPWELTLNLVKYGPIIDPNIPYQDLTFLWNAFHKKINKKNYPKLSLKIGSVYDPCISKLITTFKKRKIAYLYIYNSMNHCVREIKPIKIETFENKKIYDIETISTKFNLIIPIR